MFCNFYYIVQNNTGQLRNGFKGCFGDISSVTKGYTYKGSIHALCYKEL